MSHRKSLRLHTLIIHCDVILLAHARAVRLHVEVCADDRCICRRAALATAAQAQQECSHEKEPRTATRLTAAVYKRRALHDCCGRRIGLLVLTSYAASYMLQPAQNTLFVIRFGACVTVVVVDNCVCLIDLSLLLCLFASCY